MALISCPECKKEVSDKAESCPHCGCPLSAKPKRVRTSEDSFVTRSRGCGDIVLYGPIILFVIIVVLVLSAKNC